VLGSLSGLAAESLLVFLTRLIRTYTYVESYRWPEGTQNPFPSLQNQSSPILAKAVQFITMSSIRFSGEQNVIKLAMVCLNNLCRIGTSTQSAMWGLPEFQNMVVKPLMDIQGFRRALLPKDLTRLAECIALTCCPIIIHNSTNVD